jgi:UDP-N-acetylglucosamine 2-epimerase (non-hydrolysing)
MLTIMPVFGTRPEAIKLAPVILRARELSDRFHVRVCVTGQHREMLDPMLELFDIRPDIDLDLMRPNQTLADISSRTIHSVSAVLERERPDWVLVQGDTTTVWAAAMAAFFLGIRVGHVEAGLRTGDKRQPFPEEVNRRIATQIADLHFAPTHWAANNLRAEGIDPATIHVTGNTVVDALQWVTGRIATAPPPEVTVMREWLERHVGEARFVLITGHRRESFGEGFARICSAIAELAGRHKDVHWIYPVHLNPNVQEPVHTLLGGLANVHLLVPQPYAAFSYLLTRCTFVLTDSGGVQEEAPSLGKPVLIMRDRTERPEGVEAGVATLVGTDPSRIREHAERLLTADPRTFRRTNPYGDGKATERILEALAACRNVAST